LHDWKSIPLGWALLRLLAGLLLTLAPIARADLAQTFGSAVIIPGIPLPGEHIIRAATGLAASAFSKKQS
jgi:hypothetical protein